MAINAKTNNAIKTLALTNDISNPNLLINPNFKINQRGQSTYSISLLSGYTVDRWKLWNGTLTVNSDGTITVKSSTDCSFVQILEDECTGECCASIYVTKISGYWTLYTESDNIYDGSINLKEGLNTVKFTGCKTFAIATHGKNNDSITIKWAKLEKGTNVTQFIEPADPATELLKCQRYHQCISVDTKTCLAINNMIFLRIYGIFMRKPVTATLANDGQPKQIYVNSTTYKIDSIEFANIDYNNELYLSFTNASIVGNARYVGSFYPFSIELDAEIY